MIKFVEIIILNTQADFVFMIQRIPLHCLGSTVDINLHLPLPAQMMYILIVSGYLVGFIPWSPGNSCRS